MFSNNVRFERSTKFIANSIENFHFNNFLNSPCLIYFLLFHLLNDVVCLKRPTNRNGTSKVVNTENVFTMESIFHSVHDTQTQTQNTSYPYDSYYYLSVFFFVSKKKNISILFRLYWMHLICRETMKELSLKKFKLCEWIWQKCVDFQEKTRPVFVGPYLKSLGLKLNIHYFTLRLSDTYLSIQFRTKVLKNSNILSPFFFRFSFFHQIFQ